MTPSCLMDYIKIVIIPFVELLKALYDQSHFHFKSFFYYSKISASILYNFILYCFIFYYAHFSHLLYLKQIGFLGHKDLENDAGTFELFSKEKVWPPDHENIGGIYNNITGNIAHCPISSLALNKIMKQLTHLIDIQKAVFVDFGKLGSHLTLPYAVYAYLSREYSKCEGITHFAFCSVLFCSALLSAASVGCGSGFPCVFAMMQPFQDIVGVELHEGSAHLAEENMRRNLQKNANKCLCPNYRILCEDMLTFDFSTIVRTSITTAGQYCSLTLRPAESIVLYLYEPLWTLPKATAYEMYHSILSNALFDSPSEIKEIYFVYLFAGLYGGDALSAFNELILRLPKVINLVWEETYYGLFFGYSDKMYIYKATLSNISHTDRQKRKVSQTQKTIAA